MPYTWLPNIARYRNDDTGQFVARNTVLGYVNDSIRTAQTALPLNENGIITSGTDTLVSLVSSDLIDPDDWEDLMLEQIELEYIRQYLLGIGGREQMTPSRWREVGRLLIESSIFLAGFGVAVAARQLSEAQIRARSAMYVNGAREAYETANEIAQVEAGATEVIWVLFPPAEHCETCVEFADMGWQLIADDPYDGCIPGAGCTICLSSCRCFRDFR
jgi:broad specificity phosphatase PhoE